MFDVSDVRCYQLADCLVLLRGVLGLKCVRSLGGTTINFIWVEAPEGRTCGIV